METVLQAVATLKPPEQSAKVGELLTSAKCSAGFDAVVVGGGAAGCFFAKALVGSGVKVLLVEKDGFPRKKPCGGLLVEESADFVEKMGLPPDALSEPADLPLRHLDFDNGFDAVQGTRGLVNISREKFDEWLHLISREEASVAPHTRFLSAQPCENGKTGFLVSLEHAGKHFTIFTRFLVGADGAGSKVRGRVTPNTVSRYVAVQETGIAKQKVDEAVFVYDDSITDYYSWIVPKNGEVVVGTALRFGEQQKFSALIDKLKKKGFSWKRKKLEASLLSRPMSAEDLVFGKGNTLLLGEAAGLVSPSTGEGISFALRSGLACAKALRSGRESVLLEYEKLCKPLVRELEGKMKKAEMLSSAQGRKKIFDKITTTPISMNNLGSQNPRALP